LKKYWKGLFTWELAIPAVKVALIVGSILFIINHTGALFTGTMTTQRWFSAFLSYIVPYLVSIHGRVSSKKQKE